MEWAATEQGEVGAGVTFESPDDRRYEGGAFVVGDLELSMDYTNEAKQQDADTQSEVQRLAELPVGEASTDVTAIGLGEVPCDRMHDAVVMRLAWTDATGDQHLQEYVPDNPEGFVEVMASLCE